MSKILNKAQHAVVQKIASYFQYTQSFLRDALDPGELEENLMVFQGFNGIFYPVEGKFNLGHVLDSKKFQKSALYQAWCNCMNWDSKHFDYDTVMAYYTGCSVLAVRGSVQEGVNSERGLGAIVLAYDYIRDAGYTLYISTIQNYLKVFYPLPSDE